MSDRELLAYVDLAGAAQLVGRLWARRVRNRESASFQYDAQWRANPVRFALAAVGPVAEGQLSAWRTKIAAVARPTTMAAATDPIVTVRSPACQNGLGPFPMFQRVGSN